MNMKIVRCWWLRRVVALLLFVPSLLLADNPRWIWHDNKGAAIKPDEVRYFRKTFTVPGKASKANLSVAADDEAVVYLNGKQVAKPKDFDKPVYEEVSSALRKGENVLAVRAKNVGGDQAGVVLMLEIKGAKRQNDFVVTDESWLSSAKEEDGWQKLDFAAAGWTKAVSRGKLGDKPWGDVFKVPKATPAESLTTLPGFNVEL